VQIQPVFRSVSFDQRPPFHFLNKPDVIARYLRRLMIDLAPAAKRGFIKLLQSDFFLAAHTHSL
jgi:hypothetical protein